MTRADAHRRLLIAASELGARLAGNGKPFPVESPQYLTQRVALLAGVGALRGSQLREWSADVYARLQAAYRSGRPS